jgi:hypothetical protein
MSSTKLIMIFNAEIIEINGFAAIKEKGTWPL